MNDYMRENKIEPVAPQLTAQAPTPRAARAEGAPERAAAEAPKAAPRARDAKPAES